MRIALASALVSLALPLAGTWSTTISGAPSAQFNGVWKLRFSPAGAYAIVKSGHTLVAGQAIVNGTTVTFHDLGGPASCVGAQVLGSYTWTLTGRTLQLKPVKDTCAGRRFVLTRRFSKVRTRPAA
jgi:hypothetical protein